VRFVIAIAAFLVAAVMIGVGIAQRTVWAPPSEVTASARVTNDAPYIVITGRTLTANAGQQTLRVGGTDARFVAYGRTADVMAWIGDEPYTRLGYQAETKTLKATLVHAHGGGAADADTTASPSATPTPTPMQTAGGTSGSEASLDPKAPNPNGSDLWLEQFTGAQAATTRMNVPDDVSVIIATDGAHAAPGEVSLTWPMDSRTPWAGPLLVLGGLLFAFGVVMYILAIRHLRRGRGPRRGGGNRRALRLRRTPRAATAPELGAGTDSHGRRSLGRGMVAAPLVLVGALALSGCSSDYWPSLGHATPTPSSSPLATTLPGQGKNDPGPAVTEPQLRNIVTRIAQAAQTADAKRDANLAATRFTGAALAERTTNYRIRGAKPDFQLPQQISVGELYPVLPQATDSWPRAVNVVVADKDKKNAAPLDLVLTQESPRENYKVAYAVVMLGGATIPDLAPANIGAPAVPPDSKLLAVAPSALAQDYADVLARGKESSSYKLFDESDDGLTKLFGADYKSKTLQELASKKAAASLAFADKPGDGTPVALATNDAGALVATTVQESQTIRPNDPHATVTVNDPNGPTAALVGKTSSSKGLETTYGYQLLFYVPPAESSKKIRLLGFTQAVIGARELP
jgi:hypothetical protein